MRGNMVDFDRAPLTIDTVMTMDEQKHERIARDIGERIKTLREARHWTKGQLGMRTGINGSYFTLVEKGQRLPKLSTLSTIASAFGVPLSEIAPPELLSPTPSPHAPPPMPTDASLLQALSELSPRDRQMVLNDLEALLTLPPDMQRSLAEMTVRIAETAHGGKPLEQILAERRALRERLKEEEEGGDDETKEKAV